MKEGLFGKGVCQEIVREGMADEISRCIELKSSTEEDNYLLFFKKIMFIL